MIEFQAVERHVDLSGTPDAAALRLFNIRNELDKEVYDLPPSGLYIAATQNASTMGRAMMSSRRHEGKEVICISGSPSQITSQLQSLSMQRRSDIGLVVADFILHHFGAGQIIQTLHCLQQMTHEGIVIVAEYAFKDLPPEKIRKLTSSHSEQAKIEAYGGFDPWIKDHATLSGDSIEMALRQSNFHKVSRASLGAGRVVTIGSERTDLPNAQTLTPL